MCASHQSQEPQRALLVLKATANALEKSVFPGRAQLGVWVQPFFPLGEHPYAECSLLGASIPGTV